MSKATLSNLRSILKRERAGENTIIKLHKISITVALGFGFFSFVLCCLLIMTTLKKSPGYIIHSGPVSIVYWEGRNAALEGYSSNDIHPFMSMVQKNTKVTANVYQNWVEIRLNNGTGPSRFIPREKIVNLQFSNPETASSQTEPKFKTEPKTQAD